MARLAANGAAPGGAAPGEAAPTGDHGASASAIKHRVKHRVKHFMAIPFCFPGRNSSAPTRAYLEACGYFEASTSAIGVAARGTAAW